MLHALAINHGCIVSLRTLQRILRNNDLSRRKHYSDMDDNVQFISRQLLNSGQLHGYRWMYEKCLQAGLRVRKENVHIILSAVDPTGVCNRRARRLHRRDYFAQGPNFLWHFDSYDKLKPFGIIMYKWMHRWIVKKYIRGCLAFFEGSMTL